MTQYRRHGFGWVRFVLLTCQRCGSEWDRPVRQGPRPKFCPSCRPIVRDATRLTSPQVAKLRIVLGPVPCQGCRLPVTWNGYAWEDAAGNRHFCDNSDVGISDTPITDIMCDALLVADTSREGVPRLEVSAP